VQGIYAVLPREFIAKRVASEPRPYDVESKHCDLFSSSVCEIVYKVLGNYGNGGPCTQFLISLPIHRGLL